MQSISELFSGFLSRLTLPGIGVNDVVEIFLISFFVYQFMVWVKTTRAYTLLKGILMVIAFLILAYIFRLNTILYVFRNLANVLIIGVMVIFQPELRKVLEDLGRKQIVSSLFPLDGGREGVERFTDKTANDIVKAYAMYERALMYDWCLCNGEYSLREYSASMLPMLLNGYKNTN